MQLTHLSVVSILAAASGANAFPMPQALPDGFFKLFGFGGAPSPKGFAAPAAPVAPAPPALYNVTGSYNATGNRTSRFHVRRSVPEVVVEYNTTGGCNTTGAYNTTGEYNATGHLATRSHARRSFFPHFAVVNYNTTGSYNATGAHNSTGEVHGIAARSVAGAVAEVDSAVAAGACSYPAQYTLTHFSSFAPAFNASSSYVSFAYSEAATQIQTTCSFNASSLSLTAGTHLAPRYPCDNSGVSFIWAPLAPSNTSLGSIGSSGSSSSTAYGKLTLIEETCPGQTTTKFESTGSVLATGLRCAKVNGINATGITELSTGTAGTLCFAYGPLVGNFTSLQPSPLQ